MSKPAADLVAVVRLLVDDPRAVAVDEKRLDEEQTDLDVRVASADCGKVIGRRGRTIDALRTLADARGARDGRRYAVELVED